MSGQSSVQPILCDMYPPYSANLCASQGRFSGIPPGLMKLSSVSDSHTARGCPWLSSPPISAESFLDIGRIQFLAERLDRRVLRNAVVWNGLSAVESVVSDAAKILKAMIFWALSPSYSLFVRI